MDDQLGIPHRMDEAHGDAISAPVSAFDRWVVRQVLAAVPEMPVSITMWDGERVTAGRADAVAGITLKNRKALYRLIRNPGLNFGDLYSTGDIEVDGDLKDVLLLVRSPSHARASGLAGLWRRMAWRNVVSASASKDGAKTNIHHHYDIGNDFYALWLDQAAMQYTCAYFADPSMTLEDAQLAKMHHICRKLRLEPGQSVVEAGCGWGGFARFMAREYGVKVRAYNISREQIKFARQKAEEEGLSDRIDYVEDDFRNISGEYDAFVSVGMLEHVGLANYSALGGVIKSVLKEDGAGLIHSIGRNVPENMNPWLEKRIFPGAHAPTLKEMAEFFETGGVSVLDVENIRLHYAKTLEHWLERYEANAEKVRASYDEVFLRAFRLYLTGAMTSFLNGDFQLFQVLFAPARNNDLKWSRADIYAGESR